jgi:hypothetical protein
MIRGKASQVRPLILVPSLIRKYLTEKAGAATAMAGTTVMAMAATAAATEAGTEAAGILM